MVKFRDVVDGTTMNDWWDNGNNQIAFCRGNKGFIAINNDNYALQQNLQVRIDLSHCDPKWINALSLALDVLACWNLLRHNIR